jgi:hypothetical protein
VNPKCVRLGYGLAGTRKEAEMVIVASFTRYDVRTDRMVQPNYKMIVQTLKPEQGYVKIVGTEEDVPIDRLDDEGRYFPPV